MSSYFTPSGLKKIFYGAQAAFLGGAYGYNSLGLKAEMSSKVMTAGLKIVAMLSSGALGRVSGEETALVVEELEHHSPGEEYEEKCNCKRTIIKVGLFALGASSLILEWKVLSEDETTDSMDQAVNSIVSCSLALTNTLFSYCLANSQISLVDLIRRQLQNLNPRRTEEAANAIANQLNPDSVSRSSV